MEVILKRTMTGKTLVIILKAYSKDTFEVEIDNTLNQLSSSYFIKKEIKQYHRKDSVVLYLEL